MEGPFSVSVVNAHMTSRLKAFIKDSSTYLGLIHLMPATSAIVIAIHVLFTFFIHRFLNWMKI